MIYYLIFISVLVIATAGQCYLSVQTNLQANKTLIAWVQYLYSVLFISPLWVVISIRSKNIMFDGILYDALIMVSYVVFLGFFSKKLMQLDWISTAALLMCIVGLIVFKVRMM